MSASKMIKKYLKRVLTKNQKNTIRIIRRILCHRRYNERTNESHLILASNVI